MMWMLITIGMLICASAFFSGSETGVTLSSRAHLNQLKKEGKWRAALVLKMQDLKERFISSIMVGNNIVNIMASVLATALAISVYGEHGVLYASVSMTILVILFGEILPKTIALRHPESFALIVAPLLYLVIWLLRPITYVVDAIIRMFFRILRIPSRSAHMDDGANILRGTIELHHDEGNVVKDDRDMLGSILDLSEMAVADIMIHRKAMETLDISQPNGVLVEKVLESGHTRIPFWEHNPDNIIGVLHSKDLMRTIAFLSPDRPDQVHVRSLLKEPWFIPSTRTLKDQLKAFREMKSHFALVVDEYGDLLGLITLEDILEEIVGQIDDEHDAKARMIRPLPEEHTYVVDAGISIRDLNRELHWDLPDEDASTLAGLIISRAQIIPEVGQKFRFYNHRFEILQKKRQQLTRVKVSKDN